MFGSKSRIVLRIALNAASERLVVRTYITAPPAKSFSMKAKNTWRGISSRTPVYFASRTTPMISIGVFVPGFDPKPTSDRSKPVRPRRGADTQVRPYVGYGTGRRGRLMCRPLRRLKPQSRADLDAPRRCRGRGLSEEWRCDHPAE